MDPSTAPVPDASADSSDSDPGAPVTAPKMVTMESGFSGRWEDDEDEDEVYDMDAVATGKVELFEGSFLHLHSPSPPRHMHAVQFGNGLLYVAR
jgi:uncharacterized protein (DUF39 family)